ncbi:hypothetical protein U8V72_11190 [Priestia filamentosa]|uniref:hypothetical protein n=1 Tax=Priestia filamentosa TaxID=1402861 RepID=UPI003978BD80
MNEKTYEAVKMKFEQDKLEIEKEIAQLQRKKKVINDRKELEENKLKYSSELLKKKKVVSVAVLRQRFDYEFVKQCEKEIGLLEKYIQQCNRNIEKIKEQEKYVEATFYKQIKEKEEKTRKKEEEILIEYKKWLSFS